MATTTSEIQVTEAYIGLLGRAPDPAGLAYWTAQLDAAIAAGEDAAVALKKLTNDITLSAEWDGGLGANVATDGSVTQLGADAIVAGMYQNLFGRPATAADKTYWTAELVAGTTSASEMAVQLIQGAKANSNTTDADTLALKQEAATYYVESVPQADFNRNTATSAVINVDSPLELKNSKDATDIIVSGVGVTVAFTAATDTVAVTGGDDTATGSYTSGATTLYSSVDTYNDRSTTDNDTLTLSGEGDLTMGVTANVENINISHAARDTAQAAFDIAAANLTGGHVTLTMAETVTIGASTVAGEQTVGITNLKSNLTTVNVADLTVGLAASASHTLTLDNDAATVVVTGVDANDTNVILANNDVSLTITGTAATNDSMTISADNEVTITHNGADVELLTLSGNNNDVVFTIAGVASADADDMVYTTAGDNDITIAGSADGFNLSTFVDGSTGTVGLKLTGETAATALDTWGVLDGGIELASNNNYSLNLASGNTVTNSVAQGAAITLNANDATTDSAITVVLGQNTTGINFDKFESVTITANDSKATSTGNLDFDSVGVVTVTGANDVTVGAVANANTITVSSTGEDAVIGGVTATNEVTVTAAKSVTTAGIVAANDVTLTAGTGNDLYDTVIGGVVDVTKGNLVATGDDVNVANTITVDAGDITLTSTGCDVDLENAVTATKGTLTIIAAEDVETHANAHLISTAGTVVVSASNDVTLDEVTAKSGIDIDAGQGTGDVATIGETMSLTTAGAITIDGTAVATGANGDITNTKGNITLTASGSVVGGATAGLDVDASITATEGTITLTASSNDVDLANGATLTSTAGSVVITAANDVIGNSAEIVAYNDVTVTSTKGTDGFDVVLQDEITQTGVGTVTVSGDKVTVEEIDSTKGSIVLDASNEVVTTGVVDINEGTGTITITSGSSVGAAGVTIGGALTAPGNVNITATAEVDANADIASDNDNVTIIADQINTTNITAGGDVSLTASNAAAATVSTIGGNIAAATGAVALTDGTYNVTGTVTVRDTLTITGNTGATIATVDAGLAGALITNTANDVTITTTDAATVQADGAGATALGTLKYSDAATPATVTIGNGGSTMNINDAVNTSKFTVTTGSGVDNITITDVLAGSSVTTGGGDDIISNQETASVTIDAGAGDDQITLNVSFVGSADGGANNDTVVLTNAGVYGNADGIWKNIEQVDVAGVANGSVTISEKQMDNDGTWQYQETAGTITLTVDTTANGGGSLSAAGITFIGGSTTALTITGVAAQDDVIIGSTQVDTINANSGDDTITGGLGADVIDGGAGQDTYKYTAAAESSVNNAAAARTGFDSVTVTDTDLFDVGTTVDAVIALTQAEGSAVDANGDDLITSLNAAFQAADDGVANVEAGVIQYTGGEKFLVIDIDEDGDIDENDIIIELTGAVTGLTLTSGKIELDI